MQKTNSDSNKSGNTGGSYNQFPLDLKLKFGYTRTEKCGNKVKIIVCTSTFAINDALSLSLFENWLETNNER